MISLSRYLFSKYTAMAKKQIPVVLDQVDQYISEDVIEDEVSESVAQARMSHVRDIHDSLANLEPVQRQSHPLIVYFVNMCDITADFSSKNGSSSSKVFSYEEARIFKVAAHLTGINKFEGTMADAANVIVSYVREKCICSNPLDVLDSNWNVE